FLIPFQSCLVCYPKTGFLETPAASASEPPAGGQPRASQGLRTVGEEELGIGDQDRCRIRTHMFSTLGLDFVDQRAIEVRSVGAIPAGAGIGRVLQFDGQRVTYAVIVDRTVVQKLRHVVNNAGGGNDDGEGNGRSAGIVDVVGGGNRE